MSQYAGKIRTGIEKGHSKYNAVRTNGYASKKEAAYAAELEVRHQVALDTLGGEGIQDFVRLHVMVPHGDELLHFVATDIKSEFEAHRAELASVLDSIQF